MGRTKLGLCVLGAALALGVLGDALLRAVPWGINLPIWISTLVVSVAALARLGEVPLAGAGRWLLPTAVVFAAFVAWRAAPALVFLNVSMVLVALSLATLRARRGRLRASGVSEYLLGGLYAGLCSAAGPVPATMKDIEWREAVGGRWRPVLGIARGMLLAAPLLLIFGGLFVAADAVFEGLVLEVLDFDVSWMLGHLLLVVLFAWVSAGVLRLTLVGGEPSWTQAGRSTNVRLGIVEIGVVLGSLNALFLAFVAVQVRYLFGGAEVLSAGLTYAEYARRGFFELVAVTALVLPLLLVFHWLFRPENQRRRRLFTALAGSLLALLLMVVASALYRMWLYLEAFGLTELRFYATAFMLWLAAILSWFALTVLLCNRRDRFASGVLLAGFAAVILLNAVNPDATIARVNLNRLQSGERFDPYYPAFLSTDATPVLVEALPEMEPRKARILRRDLRSIAREQPREDWRSWNLSRWRARGLIQMQDPQAGRAFNFPETTYGVSSAKTSSYPQHGVDNTRKRWITGISVTNS